MSQAGRIITITGAESTGKTTLVRELTRILQSRGLKAMMVGEALRDFCDEHGRTPRVDEQQAIAREQTRRIAKAALDNDVVLADTSALTIAVYSDYIFADTSLYAEAEQDHAQAAMTLLTALDLPWVEDGIIRDGPHVREPVDALIRRALARSGAPYAVVSGQGIGRIERALSVIESVLDAPARQVRLASGGGRWKWFCENCDDGECEQHWLPRAST
ncbi:MAG TPA: ATP-binding protein [Candidatus Aquabacterium excrementipullorum]|nr:ATP-binding protein [Candidatus Aquabacterium excrementipullorum]